MRKLLALLILSLSASGATACEVPLALQVSGSVFERNQPVKLVVINFCSKPVRFYASLEAQQVGKEWSSWPFNINGEPSDHGNPIYKLDANSSKTLSFDIRNITLPPIPPGAKAEEADSLNFRFIIVSFERVSSGRKTEQTSSSFAIIDPFDELSGH